MKGELTISHYQGDQEGVSICVTDELSGTDFVRVRISHEQFGRALGSLAFRPCEFELRGIDLVGKRMEVKAVMLTRPDCFYDGRLKAIEAMKQAAAEYEVDGWVAGVEAAYNTQQSDRCMLAVTFRRYVLVKENER